MRVQGLPRFEKWDFLVDLGRKIIFIFSETNLPYHNALPAFLLTLL